MKVRRGRVVALVAGVSGTIMLALVLPFTVRMLLERYYIDKLSTGSQQEQERAAQRLGDLKSVRAIPGLMELFRAAYWRDDGANAAAKELPQHFSATALLRIGPRVIPCLVESLSDANYGVRMGSAMILGRFGPKAKHAGPALIATLADSNLRVRDEAFRALGEVLAGTGNVSVQFWEAVKNADVETHKIATEALGKILGRE